MAEAPEMEDVTAGELEAVVRVLVEVELADWVGLELFFC
jgi:hypothetical protein